MGSETHMLGTLKKGLSSQIFVTRGKGKSISGYSG
jgi:hypothetical protein